MPDPVYPNQYWGPVPSDDSGSQWGNRSQRSIPYRGSEQHGVPHLVDEHYEPHDVDLTHQAGYQTEGEIAVEPVPVLVVGHATPLTTQKKFITSQFPVGQNASPIQVCARRQEVTRWRLRCNSGDVVFVGPTPEQVQNQGYPLGAADFELNTNQPVYAYATSVNAVVYAVAEYDVSSGEKRE